jgi:diguanylate cyclase (GGDEF)-like protein
VACLTDLVADRSPTPAEVRLLARMSRRAARALAAASRLARAESLSTIDELTGLPNRRAFERLLARDAERVRRGRGALAVALFDLDHVKAVKDGHGHEAGDPVLVAVADPLQSALRAGDVLCRWGGEEFAALLADLPTTGAVEAAFGALERARLALSSRPVPLGEGLPPLPCTTSAGFAVLTAADPDPRAVVRQADAALYAAKRAGRDRVLHA